MEKISIVTVCYNAKNDINKTLKSVMAQSYTNIEYIIVDGGSTDGTEKIIEDFCKSAKFAVDYISEQDNGIYDAMNKAIMRSKGDWIIFMNAGDCFVSDNTISNIFKNKEYMDYDFIYGNSIYCYDKCQKNIYSKTIDKIKKTMPFCHQSVFNRARYLKNNLFSTDYKICSDYDLYFKAYLKGARFYRCDEFVSYYDCDGYSQKNFKVYLSEKADILKQNKSIKSKKIYCTVRFIKHFIGNLIR